MMAPKRTQSAAELGTNPTGEILARWIQKSVFSVPSVTFNIVSLVVFLLMALPTIKG
jgi:hypothetical protein